VRQQAVFATVLGTACATYSFAQSCDPSYPDVCIPPPPPDLDCADVSASNFKVVGSDPHGFDGDYDGIGCEE
jgi:micrococcal nuclease